MKRWVSLTVFLGSVTVSVITALLVGRLTFDFYFVARAKRLQLSYGLLGMVSPTLVVLTVQRAGLLRCLRLIGNVLVYFTRRRVFLPALQELRMDHLLRIDPARGVSRRLMQVAFAARVVGLFFGSHVAWAVDVVSKGARWAVGNPPRR